VSILLCSYSNEPKMSWVNIFGWFNAKYDEACCERHVLWK